MVLYWISNPRVCHSWKALIRLTFTLPKPYFLGNHLYCANCAMLSPWIRSRFWLWGKTLDHRCSMRVFTVMHPLPAPLHDFKVLVQVFSQHGRPLVASVAGEFEFQFVDIFQVKHPYSLVCFNALYFYLLP